MRGLVLQVGGGVLNVGNARADTSVIAKPTHEWPNWCKVSVHAPMIGLVSCCFYEKKKRETAGSRRWGTQKGSGHQIAFCLSHNFDSPLSPFTVWSKRNTVLWPKLHNTGFVQTLWMRLFYCDEISSRVKCTFQSFLEVAINVLFSGVASG